MDTLGFLRSSIDLNVGSPHAYGVGAMELRRLRQLEEENRKLKQPVPDLSLDKILLQDVLRKKSKADAA